MRSVFLVGIALFAGGTLLTAVAQDGDLLIAGRALQGAGAAFLMPASISVLNLAFPPEERGGAFGVWGAAAGDRASRSGPLYGGPLDRRRQLARHLLGRPADDRRGRGVLSLRYLGPLPRQAGPRSSTSSAPRSWRSRSC